LSVWWWVAISSRKFRRQIAALMAWYVLRPMRRAQMNQSA
jgi:hypothetical protein